MAELHEYSQYQCDVCGFRTRSPDEEEVIDIAVEHADRQHGETLDRDAVRDDLRTLELEGFPENA